MIKFIKMGITSNISSYYYSFVMMIVIVLCTSSCHCNAYRYYKNMVKPEELNINNYESNSNVSQAMFVFGDSMSDIGNAVIYDTDVYNPSAHHPYGFTYFPSPTGRQSDGLLVPDIIGMLADVHVAVPYLLGDVPFTYGANFAFQGAAILAKDNPGAMDLPQQLDGFYNVLSNWTSELGSDEALEKLNKAVILIGLGGVDYVTYSTATPNATQAEQQEFVTLVIDALVIAIKAMYNEGARKFAFQNVAALGCLPLSRVSNGVIITGDCSEFQESNMAKMHNVALSNATEVLETELSNFEYGIYDFYTAQLDMIRNPNHYGFSEGEIACCGSGMLNYGKCGEEPYMLCTNPGAYVFFDYAHHSQRANLILSQAFWEGSSQINNATMEPYSLKQLFNVSSSTSSSRLMVL